MKKAMNIMKGVKAMGLGLKPKPRKEHKKNTKAENIELCTNSSYKECKSGICDYYKEHSV